MFFFFGYCLVFAHVLLDWILFDMFVRSCLFLISNALDQYCYDNLLFWHTIMIEWYVCCYSKLLQMQNSQQQWIFANLLSNHSVFIIAHVDQNFTRTCNLMSSKENLIFMMVPQDCLLFNLTVSYIDSLGVTFWTCAFCHSFVLKSCDMNFCQVCVTRLNMLNNVLIEYMSIFLI